MHGIGGTGSDNLRAYFENAVFEFWSKIKKMISSFATQAVLFLQNSKPADIYGRMSCTWDKLLVSSPPWTHFCCKMGRQQLGVKSK